MHRYTQMYTDTHRCAQVYTGVQMYTDAHEYTWVPRGMVVLQYPWGIGSRTASDTKPADVEDPYIKWCNACT